jgi:hypothetical protein
VHAQCAHKREGGGEKERHRDREKRAQEREIQKRARERIICVESIPEEIDPWTPNKFKNTVSGGPVCQLGFSYRPARVGIDSWAP